MSEERDERDRLSERAVARLRAVADLPDLTGTRYTLIGEIGRGGMGTVYRARDTQLEREVALKVVGLSDASGDFAARLWLEARLLAGLEHPNLVPVHDAGVLPDGRVFYVMKLVRGRRLDEWMRSSPGRTETLRLFQKICEAVAFAHAHGVVHRDLKPENVMVGAFGEALVMDWGVAKVLAGSASGADRLETDPESSGSPSSPEAPRWPAGLARTAAGSIERASDAPIEARASRGDSSPTVPIGGTDRGTIVGTPGYMAPEQERGETDRIDGRADVYALGGILHFVLHGRPPGDAPEGSSVHGPVPRALDAIRIKAMAPDPAGRYQTALELAADVDRFLDGSPVAAYREGLLERTGRLLSRNRTIVVLVLAYLLMRMAVLIFWGR